MMYSIHAISYAPAVHDWMTNSQHPVVLHVFDDACNLINGNKDVLSIVTKHIGRGPFSLVIEEDVLFVEHVTVDSHVIIHDDGLEVGNLIINMKHANLWSPCPNWEWAHAKREIIRERVAHLPVINYQPALPLSLLSTFSKAIATADVPTCVSASKQLAGLGQGLTPSGDDFILGALYAAWIIHPPEIARNLANALANTAAPLTTSLSAAWLKSAGRGEAGILWHEFLDALISTDVVSSQIAADKIVAVGETSGADALSGFVSSCLCENVDAQ
jgi:hypothetical protein